MDFTLKFDEFFKRSAKFFFPLLNFRVETEHELYHLPKKLDVLVIEAGSTVKVRKEFSYFHYFNQYNLISFKSPTDNTRSHDFTDAIVYYNGYLSSKKEANHKNTTITLIVNVKPVKFLKENKSFIIELKPGHYIANYNLFKLHILDLTSLKFEGTDGKFLLSFATEKKLVEFEGLFKEFFDNYAQKDKKIVDEIKKMLSTRINSFNTGISFKDEIMPTLAKADVREWAEPYFVKVREEAWEEKAVEDAKKMLLKNYPVNDVVEITGLSKRKVSLLKKDLPEG